MSRVAAIRGGDVPYDSTLVHFLHSKSELFSKLRESIKASSETSPLPSAVYTRRRFDLLPQRHLGTYLVRSVARYAVLLDQWQVAPPEPTSPHILHAYAFNKHNTADNLAMDNSPDSEDWRFEGIQISWQSSIYHLLNLPLYLPKGFSSTLHHTIQSLF